MAITETSLPRTTTKRADRRFYGVPTEELLLDLSLIRQCRLDTIDDMELPASTRENTLSYLERRAKPIIAEVKRRHEQHERHKADPSVGAWPTADRYQKLLEQAQALKQQIALSGYVQSVLPEVKLRKAGRSWKGHCPFHDDPGPSFHIFDEDHFHCFGCGASGDVFELAKRIDGLERFTDQVRSVAGWAGLVVKYGR